MNDPYSTPSTFDPAELAEWNRGNQRAIKANRDRKTRETFLDSLYYPGSVKK